MWADDDEDGSYAAVDPAALQVTYTERTFTPALLGPDGDVLRWWVDKARPGFVNNLDADEWMC